MSLETVLAKLNSDVSIRAAFLLEGEFYKEVVAEEGSITESSMGMSLLNKALEEVLKKRVAVCLFCESSFELPTDHIMVLEDGCGNRVGHDIPRCMANDFTDEGDIFWLCDDFVIYPRKAQSEKMIMVMLPQRVNSIGKEEGVSDPILLYPATTTDIMLRKHFGIPLSDPAVASAILAFDII